MMDVYDMLKSQLNNNKITVEIKPNEYNENMIFSHIDESPCCYDHVFGSTLNKKIQNKIEDIIMYADCFMTDKTISLLRPHDVNKRVADCKHSLMLSVSELQLKKVFKSTANITEFKAAMMTSKRTSDQDMLVCTYIGNKNKINVIVEDKLMYCWDVDQSSYLHIKNCEASLVEDGFRNYVQAYIKENLRLSGADMKKVLVKDLKLCAAVLQIKGLSKLTKDDLISKLTALL